MKLAVVLFLFTIAPLTVAAQSVQPHAECKGDPERRDFVTRLFCGLDQNGALAPSQNLEDFRAHYAACQKGVDKFAACLSTFPIEIQNFKNQASIDLVNDGFQELSKIKDKCRSEWPDDFKMQSYCVDRQIGAGKRVLALITTRPPDIPELPYLQITVNCRKEWPDDWSMIEYCMKKQYEGFRKLR